MNIFVLSELSCENKHVGWSVSHSLEETLASACQAQFIYPYWNGYTSTKPLPDAVDQQVSFLNRCRNRLLKSWYTVEAWPELGPGLNILLVVGIRPKFLLSMFALGPVLDQFDLRVGYLLDGFDPCYMNQPPLTKLDHLFVISDQLANEVRSLYSVNVSWLPLGINTLAWGNYSTHRSIDLMGYGRMNEAVHTQLQQHFNQADSDRIYFHSTFTCTGVANPKEHIALQIKLLKRSKINLCFEVSNISRFCGRSPLLYRWLEGWAAGSAIVGTKPRDPEVGALMDWPNSALELPTNPEEWIPFLETLLDDEAKLAEISHRNYRECRLRHDWRYRLRDFFTMMHLPLPQTLEQELAEIRQRLGLNEKVQDGPRVLEGIRQPVEVREFQGMRSRY
jgi:hypothetical protein